MDVITYPYHKVTTIYSHVDGLVQKTPTPNTIANALKLRLSRTNPSIYAAEEALGLFSYLVFQKNWKLCIHFQISLLWCNL